MVSYIAFDCLPCFHISRLSKRTMRYTLLFPVLLLICVSCQSGNSEAKNMATDVCTCFKPLVDISDQVQMLLNNKRASEAELLLPKITQTKRKSQACAASMKDKYGADTAMDTDAVKASMREQCPKILETLGEGLFAK